MTPDPNEQRFQFKAVVESSHDGDGKLKRRTTIEEWDVSAEDLFGMQKSLQALDARRGEAAAANAGVDSP